MIEYKFKVGDWFKYDIKSMVENGYDKDDYDNRRRKVVSVEFVEGLGEIVGYGNKKFPAQINSDWLILCS